MRSIPAQARASLNAESGGYSLPVLMEITHGVSGYPNPLRIVNNTVSLTYDGNEYLPYPFRFDPPDVLESGQVANARLTISAVDQQIAAIIRSTSVPPTVRAIAMYYSDETGSTVFEPIAAWDHILRKVSGNDESISAELIYEDRLDNEVPGDEFRPTTFPGAF